MLQGRCDEAPVEAPHIRARHVGADQRIAREGFAAPGRCGHAPIGKQVACEALRRCGPRHGAEAQVQPELHELAAHQIATRTGHIDPARSAHDSVAGHGREHAVHRTITRRSRSRTRRTIQGRLRVGACRRVFPDARTLARIGTLRRAFGPDAPGIEIHAHEHGHAHARAVAHGRLLHAADEPHGLVDFPAVARREDHTTELASRNGIRQLAVQLRNWGSRPTVAPKAQRGHDHLRDLLLQGELRENLLNAGKRMIAPQHGRRHDARCQRCPAHQRELEDLPARELQNPPRFALCIVCAHGAKRANRMAFYGMRARAQEQICKCEKISANPHNAPVASACHGQLHSRATRTNPHRIRGTSR